MNPVRDMSKEKPAKREATVIRDLSTVLKEAPAGAWVALSADETRIVGTGSTMQAAALQAQLNHEYHPVLVKMPLPGEGFAAGVR